MIKQNITLYLPKDVLRKARVFAVERKTSVSGLVVELLTDLVKQKDQYISARSAGGDAAGSWETDSDGSVAGSWTEPREQLCQVPPRAEPSGLVIPTDEPDSAHAAACRVGWRPQSAGLRH